MIGSLIIVLHAPEDKPVETVDEILHYALQPGTLCLSRRGCVCDPSTPHYLRHRFPDVLLQCPRFLPRHDLRCRPSLWPLQSYRLYFHLFRSWFRLRNGFGVAVKLTLSGKNQFTHPSTYVFGIVVTLCIIVQMNYFNKALDTFSTNV